VTRELLLRWLLTTVVIMGGAVAVILLLCAITGLDPRGIPPHRYVIPAAGSVFSGLIFAVMSMERRAKARGEAAPKFDRRIPAVVLGAAVLVASLLLVFL
jgi:hypothetical protein